MPIIQPILKQKKSYSLVKDDLLIERGIYTMTDCTYCRKKVLMKLIMDFYDIKTGEIAKEINVSDSLVRKHINGARTCQPVDIYIIEKVFRIKIKDYSYSA